MQARPISQGKHSKSRFKVWPDINGKPAVIPTMSTNNLTQSLKTEAKRLGFDLCGACPAVSPVGYSAFEEWLDAGYAGEMHYLPKRREAYADPRHVMDGAQSILMLGINYQTQLPAKCGFGQGRVSRYAWSDVDYHDLIHKKLKSMVRFCIQQDADIQARGIVDTAPLLEREFAQLAGLGWQAKNTMLINREIGSWFFLAALLLNVKLEYDQPFGSSHCGTCTACLDACPTDAFVKPGVLDAKRCISYLTIELRKPIPLELRAGMEQWVFGCDVCQDVCPWNKKAANSNEQLFQPRSDNNPLNLRDLFFMDDEHFRSRFRSTPLWRSKRRGIVRNAAIVLGNNPVDDNVQALARGLNDAEELIRGASAWSLGKHSADLAAPLLLQRQTFETDADVQLEIELALTELNIDNE